MLYISHKNCCYISQGIAKLTTSLSAADGAVRRVVQITTDEADFGVNQALAGKVSAVEVLGAPVAAGGDGAALGAFGDGGSGCGGGFRGDGEAGGSGEGAGEAGEDVEDHDGRLVVV